MTTEASGGIRAHSSRPAVDLTGAGPVSARPCATGVSPPDLPVWLSPTPNVVATVGTSIAATQNAPATAAVTGCAPRSRARRASQDAAHSAQMISPGITITISRRLAHGWSGTMSGCPQHDQRIRRR